ncbi:protein kinase domain-containing protein [Streptomyces ziwulingensis]
MRLRESAQAMMARCSTEVLSGRYRLDDRLGSGGAADVHRGFDLRLKRPVALKVFRPGTGFDMTEDLHGEAVILARLQHPGLVTAYDAGEHDGRAFLVMQLVEGPTLKSLIVEGPLAPRATAAIGAGLAGALSHAHAAGIIHRDVKPSNILLDAAHHPYLTDFGISRQLDATTCTATGTLVGTAAYLSPEQVLGRPVGRPADVYALGLVLLECLTGRVEYEGGPLEAAIARLHRPPFLPDSLPRRLADLLRDMTALDEQDRPPARVCADRLTALADTSLPDTACIVLSADPTGPVAGHAVSPAADRTHQREGVPADDVAPQPPPDDESAPRRTSGRRHALVAGAAVALAAALSTALVTTDDSASHDSDRSASSASSAPDAAPDPPGGEAREGATSDPPGGEARKGTSTAPATPSAEHSSSVGTPSDRASAVGTVSDHAPGPGARPASQGPGSTQGTGATVQESAVQATSASPGATQQSATAPRGGATAGASDLPPGLAKKEELPGKAQQKKNKEAKNQAE